MNSASWRHLPVKYDPQMHVWSPLSVPDVGAMFRQSEARWWLSGGLALDTWLGRRTREHSDIDVSVLRADWPGFADVLPRVFEPFAAVDGYLHPITTSSDASSINNVWVRHSLLDRWVLQVNLEEGDSTHWRYRRNPAVGRTWAKAIELQHGMPIVNPAVQLLGRLITRLKRMNTTTRWLFQNCRSRIDTGCWRR